MRLVAQYRAMALGAYDIIDLDQDRLRIGSVSWTKDGGYQTKDQTGAVTVYSAESLVEALADHARFVAKWEVTHPMPKTRFISLSKVCEVCAIEKEIAEFSYTRFTDANPDGRANTCIACVKEIEWMPWREKAELKERMKQQRLGGF